MVFYTLLASMNTSHVCGCGLKSIFGSHNSIDPLTLEFTLGLLSWPRMRVNSAVLTDSAVFSDSTLCYANTLASMSDTNPALCFLEQFREKREWGGVWVGGVMQTSLV